MHHSTVGSLLRSTQAHCLQLCEKETLEHGIAYSSERFPTLTETNQFREVLIDDPGRIPDAFRAAQAWFARRGLACRCWTPAEGKATPELDAFLSANGYRRNLCQAMTLSEWVALDPSPTVRILPARAMREALRRTLLDDADPTSPELRKALAEAQEERLNDPQWDMFVALVDGAPAGRCALYQVGDIARVMDWTALPGPRAEDVRRSLLCHVLALARRLMMRNICAQIDAGDDVRLHGLQRAGFRIDGQIVEFHQDSTLHSPSTS